MISFKIFISRVNKMRCDITVILHWKLKWYLRCWEPASGDKCENMCKFVTVSLIFSDKYQHISRVINGLRMMEAVTGDSISNSMLLWLYTMIFRSSNVNLKEKRDKTSFLEWFFIAKWSNLKMPTPPKGLVVNRFSWNFVYS